MFFFLSFLYRERASAILAVDVSFSGTNDMSFFIFFIGGINDYDYLPVSFYWPLKFYSILAREKKIRTQLSFVWTYNNLQIQPLEHSTGLFYVGLNTLGPYKNSTTQIFSLIEPFLA